MLANAFVLYIFNWTTHLIPAALIFSTLFISLARSLARSAFAGTIYKLLTHKTFRAYYLLRIFDVRLFTARKSHEIYLKYRWRRKTGRKSHGIRKKERSDKWSILCGGWFFHSHFTLATEVYFCHICARVRACVDTWVKRPTLFSHSHLLCAQSTMLPLDPVRFSNTNRTIYESNYNHEKLWRAANAMNVNMDRFWFVSIFSHRVVHFASVFDK